MERVRIKISCILLLLDDYTGMPIKGTQVAARTRQGEAGYVKDLGYVVFMNTGEEKQEIILDSPYYQKQEVCVEVWNGAGEVKPFLVRLLPDRGYKIPAGATILTGKAKPGSRVLAFLQQPKSLVRLSEDYKEGTDSISLFCRKGDIQKEEMAIWELEAEKAEYFRLGEVKNGEKNEFHLKTCLSRAYKKSEAAIGRVSSATVKEDGSYFLLLKNVPESGGLCIVMVENENIVRSFPVKYENLNHFDLL